MSHFERRAVLRELERLRPEVKSKGIRDRYMARFRVLHGETFYEGLIDVEEIRFELEKVKEYIDDIETIIRSTKQST